jgi:hypothetical protein
MKFKRSKNSEVSVVLNSKDFNLNDVVVKVVKLTKGIRVFRKMDDGTFKELKKVRSVEKSLITTETPAERVSDTSTSKTSNNKVGTITEESNRQTSWRKFRTAIAKVGGIDVYMNSHRDDNIINMLLLNYPDFKRGMKLYEAGGNGAWTLLAERSIESVRRTYQKYYMDLDLLLAA